MKKSTIALVVSALLAAQPTVSATEKQSWLGGFAEYYYADKDKFVQPTLDRVDWGAGLEFGTRFSENWAVRFEYARIDLEAYPGQARIDGNRYGVDAMYFLESGSSYVFSGLKMEELDKDYGLLNVGVGRHWNLSDHWKVITEITAYHDFGQGFKDYSGKLGVAYQFGGGSKNVAPKDGDSDGVPDTQDRCPNTLVGYPVNASGCALDTDKDGVANGADSCPNTPVGTRVDRNGCARVLDQDRDGVVDARDKCPDTPKMDKVDGVGCTMFAESQDTISLAVSFANNSSVIANPQHADFQRFADFMQRYPEQVVEIEGHSSAPGRADYNLWISQQRANAVRALLIDVYGIEAARISALGYGETQLLDTANTAEAHAKNRRISATLLATKRERLQR